jgi:hypothetical protein
LPRVLGKKFWGFRLVRRTAWIGWVISSFDLILRGLFPFLGAWIGELSGGVRESRSGFPRVSWPPQGDLSRLCSSVLHFKRFCENPFQKVHPVDRGPLLHLFQVPVVGFLIGSNGVSSLKSVEEQVSWLL